jgi:hypothetical protein
VHKIAVLADQRHRARQALTSDPLEEWHRYNMPSFTEWMRTRLQNHCQQDHQFWVGQRPLHPGTSLKRVAAAG